MPEGVEVLLSAELIRPLAIGKEIASLRTTPNSRYGETDLIPPLYQGHPLRVQRIDTRGKFLYWTLRKIHWTDQDPSDGACWLLATFGMSGQFSPQAGKHPCMEMKFRDGSAIYFNDPRHFGTIKFVSDRQVLTDKLASLGWDPLQDQLSDYREPPSYTYFDHIQQSLQTTKPIGQLLMDQSIFAGSGNYVRAESLYAAKLSPWRQGKSLSFEEILSLCESIKTVMQDSYNHQGATILTYRDAYGAEGKYSGLFKCYGQKKDPEGHPIIKEPTPDGRTMHWCPMVQS